MRVVLKNVCKDIKGARVLDNVNLDVRFRQTAAASVAYMIMQRMGLQPENTFEGSIFNIYATLIPSKQ